ncbi:MAG: hypothetical protein AB7F86_14550, partial [Bdellovibrionales bacterium]
NNVGASRSVGLYFDASNNVRLDPSTTNSDLILASTGSKVGIGSTAPARTLDVVGNFQTIGGQTTTASGWQQLNNIAGNNAPSASAVNTDYQTMVIDATVNSTNNTGVLTSTMGYVANYGTGGLNVGRSFYGFGDFSGGNATEYYGFSSDIQVPSGHTVANYKAFVAGSPTDATGITNSYGLYIEDQSATTDTFGVYQADSSDKNYFAGNVGIGTTDPATKFMIRNTDTRNTASYFSTSDTTVDVAPGSASSAFAYYAAFNRLTSSSSNLGSADLYGLDNSVHLYGGTGSMGAAYGSMNSFSNFAGRTINAAHGSYNFVVNNHASGTISNAHAVQAYVTNTSGTITNAVGVYIGTVEGTNRWSLFADDSNAKSYFAGSVGIGTDNPATKLHVNGGVQIDGALNARAEVIQSNVNASGAVTLSSLASGSAYRVTLTGNSTLTLPSDPGVSGAMAQVVVKVAQDGSGSHTLAWSPPGGDSILWTGGVTPAVCSGANQITIYQFVKINGDSNWYGSQVWRQCP